MKKAILVVSFGTTFKETLKLTIDKIEERIREKFSDYEVRRAFTAHKIIKKLKERDGIHIDTPEEALEKLRLEGYEEVILQPLHIIPGEEYEYVKLVVEGFKNLNAFNKIELGRPVLCFPGCEELIEDYDIFVKAIKGIIAKDKTVVFMGHGSIHYSNICYSYLQKVFFNNGYKNVFIGTFEGYPTIDNIVRKLKLENVREVVLIPLMLVAGKHAINDMSSIEEDSWKSILEREGINCEVYLHGLGEIKEFQDIYIDHISDVVEVDRKK